MLRRMAYFLEYTTDQAAGRSRIQCVSVAEALTRANDALRGLRCTSAVLRHAPESSPAFGEGFVLAAYTPVEGWRTCEAALE